MCRRAPPSRPLRPPCARATAQRTKWGQKNGERGGRIEGGRQGRQCPSRRLAGSEAGATHQKITPHLPAGSEADACKIQPHTSHSSHRPLILALVALLAATAAVAADAPYPKGPRVHKPISDYGKNCTDGSQCQSGICGNACVARSFSPFDTEECICPCASEAAEESGGVPPSCCCGCAFVSQSGGAAPSVSACQAGDAVALNATAPEGAPVTGLKALPDDDIAFFYARLKEAGALTQASVEWGDAVGVIRERIHDGAQHAGGKPFGTPCARGSDCASGICTTGCECDEQLDEHCTCLPAATFPMQVCGGCIMQNQGGNGTTVGPCPRGVEVDYLEGGVTLWVPSSPDARVTPAFCTVIELLQRDPKWKGYVPFYPPACNRGAAAAVGKAFKEVNTSDPSSVKALYGKLLKLICTWKPRGGAKLAACAAGTY